MNTDCAEGAVLLRKQTTLSRFLSVPDLRVKKTHQPKSSARVLTSLENLLLIEEKEKQKREKETLKKERLRKREEKQQLKHQGFGYEGGRGGARWYMYDEHTCISS